jgi:hypothetical protein
MVQKQAAEAAEAKEGPQTMNPAKKTHAVSPRDLDILLTGLSSDDRTALLHRWKNEGKTIDDSILKGLMSLPISHQEVIAAIEICATNNRPDFELWLMNNLLAWEQNVASVAIRAWARVTDRILWHRLIPIAAITSLPQRIRYTILDIAPDAQGYELSKATLESGGWEDLSSAFHALLIERALEYDLSSERLTKLSWSIVDLQKDHHGLDHKPLNHALIWLIRHDIESLEKWANRTQKNTFVQLVKAVIQTHEARSSILSRLQKSLLKSPSDRNIGSKLPAVWSRSDVPDIVTQQLLNSTNVDRDLIAGMPRSQILKIAESNETHESWSGILLRALPWKKNFHHQRGSHDPFTDSCQSDAFPDLEDARSLAQQGRLGIATDKVQKITDFSALPPAPNSALDHPIKSLFLAIRQEQQPSPSNDVWGHLAEAWLSPEKTDINALSSLVRKHKGLAAIAHIKVLSRFRNRDDAVLKLLDYIRSDDPSEIRAVARALGDVNTKRSLLELVAMLTRPNATIPIQQEIVAILASKDLKDLQKELRSAIQDIKPPVNADNALYQIKDELSAMLIPLPENSRENSATQPSKGVATSDGDLDRELGGMIPHYRDLSSEVKRALRTALFFNQTILGTTHINEIDLSPLIDMQYKAMELLYREFFEESVSQSLQKGQIQRKLDVIGYARPIVRQMDDFESYIASLPVVKEIPFFSKFKLRKMLRAICQFEPGRRFTLDGLKAFGLYFLVFGRQNCKAGLSGLFNVGTSDDHELAAFCRELHVFQDFRNRAAHEGFHPDASNDIHGIWRTTTSLVQWAFKIKHAQKLTASAISQSKSAS